MTTATAVVEVNLKYDGKDQGSFMGEPSMILHGIEGVREALANTSWKGEKHPYRYHVKSDWLISLIDEIVRGNDKGFAYNADVRIMAENRLGGYPKRTDAEYCQEGTPLSMLVYNAQKFRSSDNLLAEGYVPVSQEMVDQAFTAGCKIKTPCHLYNVRKVNGKCYAFKPRKRKYALDTSQGAPAKIV